MTDVVAQGQLLAQAFVLGGGLGVWYDVLRALRRCHRHIWLTVCLDLLFWLTTVICLLCHALLWGDGQVRLYYSMACLGGTILYFMVLSPVIFPIFLFLLEKIGRILWKMGTPMRLGVRGGKKLLKNEKKGFQNWWNWYKIYVTHGWKHPGEEGQGPDED